MKVYVGRVTFQEAEKLAASIRDFLLRAAERGQDITFEGHKGCVRTTGPDDTNETAALDNRSTLMLHIGGGVDPDDHFEPHRGARP